MPIDAPAHVVYARKLFSSHEYGGPITVRGM
jgi:hypothetical protein